MKVSAWVRKHRKAVVFLFAVIFNNFKTIVILPIGLGDFFYFCRIVLRVSLIRILFKL